ncbi:MAG TPA: glutaredoxin family protein [Pirellulales bacterium]|nr:glutaredoxin family protein [Pirellulales bacterium]
MSRFLDVQQRPGGTAMANRNVVLYTRQGCHLCHEAEQILIKHGLCPRLVDIDLNDQLLAQFDTCVPVVEIDGRIRFRGQVDEVLLRRLLRANS